MATKVVQHKRPAKTATGAPEPFVVHMQGDDGSETVCLGNLRVLITGAGNAWLAQGLEIDYAIDGESVDDVKKRFEEGLALTVKSHLRVYKGIRNLLRIAPQAVWDKFFAAVPPDLQHQHGLITVKTVSRKHQQALPFDRIIYAKAA